MAKEGKENWQNTDAISVASISGKSKCENLEADSLSPLGEAWKICMNLQRHTDGQRTAGWGGRYSMSWSLLTSAWPGHTSLSSGVQTRQELFSSHAVLSHRMFSPLPFPSGSSSPTARQFHLHLRGCVTSISISLPRNSLDQSLWSSFVSLVTLTLHIYSLCLFLHGLNHQHPCRWEFLSLYQGNPRVWFSVWTLKAKQINEKSSIHEEM